MAQKIADRLLWAVEVLNIEPHNALLEIGCGAGIAVQMICERLTTGKIIAVDQSQAMIAAARKRNSAGLAAEKADFQLAPLSQVDVGEVRFDKIFAVNVNVFWQKPDNELAVIKNLLKPDGRAYFFFQPPVASKVADIAARLKHNLQQNRLVIVHEQVKDLHPAPALVVIAQVS